MKWVQDKSAAGEIQLPIASGAVAEQAKLPAAEVYGKLLDRQFREAFPTTAFTGGLERALQNGGARGLRRARDISRFLDRHETFELLNTPVDDFLKNGIHPDFQELIKNQDFRLEVKAVQRVFKLAPTFEATNALLADDLHSAQKFIAWARVSSCGTTAIALASPPQPPALPGTVLPIPMPPY